MRAAPASHFVLAAVAVLLAGGCQREKSETASQEGGEVAPAVLSDPESEVPDAAQILRGVHIFNQLGGRDVSGRIESGHIKVPLMVYSRGADVQVQIYDQKKGQWSPIHFRFGGDGLDILAWEGERFQRFPEGRFGDQVVGTEVTYGDLVMDFLYWPNGIVEGSEKIKGLDAWRVRLINPTPRQGRYAQVRVWVHQRLGVPLQTVGFDAGGRPLRRLQVADIGKVEGNFVLRRMRIDKIDPVENKIIGKSYLEFDKPKSSKRWKLGRL